jgi:hypothetical protein
MKPRYEVIETPTGNTVINAYYDNGVMISIPMDESNADYQRYLNPESEQSTPIVTDETKTK